MKKTSGLSVFELLVVVTIFAIIAVIANQAFFSTLRGGAKSEVGVKVKDNANYVISSMERGLYSAREIVTCSDTAGTNDQEIIYKDINLVETSYSCADVDDDTGYVSSGSARLTASDVAVTACSFVCTQTGTVKTVDINLTLEEGATENALRSEEKDSFQVQTKVIVRNSN